MDDELEDDEDERECSDANLVPSCKSIEEVATDCFCWCMLEVDCSGYSSTSKNSEDFTEVSLAIRFLCKPAFSSTFF